MSNARTLRVSERDDAPVARELLAEVRRVFPELNPQDAFLVPTWYYRQNHWIEDSVGSENALYNFPIGARITGLLDTDILRRSLAEVQRRHEVLRSVFRVLDGDVVQVVVPSRAVTFNVVDLSGLPEPARETKLASLMLEEAHRPFELSTDVLLRANVFRLGADAHVLQINTHHLVCDDWSSGILISEVFALYDFLVAGAGERLPDSAFSYGDFIRWRLSRAHEDKSRQTSWKTKLSSNQGFYHLPADFQRPARRSSRGDTVRYTLPSQLEKALRRLSQENKITLFMALLAGFQCLLHLYSGDTDVGVGTCAANRPLPAVENLIGRFANDLVVRTDYSYDPSFREALSRTRDAALDAYGYQDLPFGAVLEELVPDTDPSTTPLFQSMFILQNAPKVDSRTGAITVERLFPDTKLVKYDLAVWLKTKETVEIAFEYTRDLFRRETITQMVNDYETVLSAMAADVSTRVSELPIGRLRPAQPARQQSSCASESALPRREEIETELLRIWADILRVQDIRVTDDFFDLGGDSLRATQILSRVEQKFGAGLPLQSLFSSRTIQQQALAIEQLQADKASQDRSSQVDQVAAPALNPYNVPSDAATPTHKSILRKIANRFLHVLTRFLPGATTLRPFLHRLRGVRIGKGVWIGDEVYLENEYPERVELQDGAMVGLRSTLVAHTRGAGRIVIGKNAFIGAGSIIVTSGNRPLVIGEGAVIMASTLVTGSIAPYTLYGSDSAKPLARITKPFTATTTFEELMSSLRPLSD